MTSSRLTFIVRLWLNGTDIAAYEDFERDAAQLMEKYGGRIERAIRIAAGDIIDAPFEIHIVSFPDRDAFENYRNDPESHALAGRRRQVIARTEILFGTDVESYHQLPIV